jgi:hypothetical protein
MKLGNRANYVVGIFPAGWDVPHEHPEHWLTDVVEVRLQLTVRICNAALAGTVERFDRPGEAGAAEDRDAGRSTAWYVTPAEYRRHVTDLEEIAPGHGEPFVAVDRLRRTR